MQVIDQQIIDNLVRQSRESARLRMNYNLHTDLNDKCQRLLNAMQPGTKVPIHHHKVAEACFILQGSIRAITYSDEGEELSSAVLGGPGGNRGVEFPANTWHSVEVLEPDSVIFEVKEGPFIPHDQGGILSIKKAEEN